MNRTPTLSKLSPEQEIILQDTVSSYEELYYSFKFDEEKARDFCKWMYERAKVYTPLFQVIVANSPRAAQQIGKCLQLIAAGSGKALERKGDPKWDYLYDTHWAQLCKMVEDYFRDPTTFEGVGFYFPKFLKKYQKDLQSFLDTDTRSQNALISCRYFDVSECFWIAFNEFFDQLHMLRDAGDKPDEDYDFYKEYHQKWKESGIFYAIAMNNVVIIAKPPMFIQHMPDNRMHCVTGPCAKWADGFEVYQVKGTTFPKKIFDEMILVKPSAKEIFKMSNAEMRAVIIDHWGFESVMEELTLKTLDSIMEDTPLGPKPVDLLETHIDNIPIHVLRMSDHSTPRRHLILVPVDCTTVKEALAWSYGFDNPGDYHPSITS